MASICNLTSIYSCFSYFTQAAPQKKEEHTAQQIIEILKSQKSENLITFFQSDLPKLIDTMNLEHLNQSIKTYHEDFIDAFEHAKELMSCIEQNKSGKMVNSIEGHSTFLFRFFSNLIETFITAFNFYDESSPPTSIYEKQVLIQIYYRFFQIPFALALMLQPLVLVAWKAYAIAMAILAAGSIGIYIYVKWLKPFPHVIHHCENIDLLIHKQFQSTILGLDSEMEMLIASLNSPSSSTKKTPVMLLGDIGQGKTTLIFKLYQMIKDEKVPFSLKNKKIVFIHGGKLMAKSSTAFAEKIKEIRAKLSGYEKDTIVFIDEIQAVAQNGACFDAIKDFVRTPDLQIIAATTYIGFEAIENADRDGSFRDSFHRIPFEEWKMSNVKSILEEIVEKEADSIPITEDAIQEVIKLTQKDFSLRRTIGLLKRAINTCQTNYVCAPANEELRRKKEELERIKRKIRNNQTGGTLKEKLVLEKEINQLEQAQQQLLNEAAIVQGLINQRNKLKQQIYKDANLIVQNGNQHKQNSALHKRYLLFYFYLLPALDSLIDERVTSEQFKGKLKLQVNKQFIQEIFQEKKRDQDIAPTFMPAFKGIIDAPSKKLIEEVEAALKLSIGVPHSMGKPNFEDLLKERWTMKEKMLRSEGFKNFEDYLAVICAACENGIA